MTQAASSDLLQTEVEGEELVPTMTIVAHPELHRLGSWRHIPDERCELSRMRPLFTPYGGGVDMPLGDAYLSRSPMVTVSWTGRSVRVLRAAEPARVRVDGGSLGPLAEIGMRALRRGVLLELEPRTALMIHLTRSPRPTPGPTARFLEGVSRSIEQVRSEIERLAGLDLTVLVRGDTGTGKERVARALHELGGRADGPYVAVNIGGIAPGLVGSELFGHTRGAYSGADDVRQGHFRAADGGTLLLDEIGEANDQVQRALLRALQFGRVRPVGSDADIPVDVRVIAATDAPLEHAIAARTFRQPLYHRLAQYEIRLPALAERRVDIPILFARIAEQLADDMGVSRPACTAGNGERWLDTSQVRRLLRHDWPGNVRELQNVARRALVEYPRVGKLRVSRDLSGMDTAVAPTEDRERTSPKHATIPPGADTRPPAAAIDDTPSQPRRAVRDIDVDEVLDALRAERWRPGEAAERLGISRTSMYQLIRQHDQVPESRLLSRDDIEQALAANDGDVEAAAMSLRVPLRGLKLRMTRLGLSAD